MKKVWAHDVKFWATLTREAMLSPKGGGDQNLRVRFWIITMMLVLFGLSTLKLR
jgi:UDP-N-acetylmuramyl pentapeptide phosphotransferase/UDP-N-acetylglucosamine-1-phosphate transferase